MNVFRNDLETEGAVYPLNTIDLDRITGFPVYSPVKITEKEGRIKEYGCPREYVWAECRHVLFNVDGAIDFMLNSGNGCPVGVRFFDVEDVIADSKQMMPMDGVPGGSTVSPAFVAWSFRSSMADRSGRKILVAACNQLSLMGAVFPI